MRKTTSAWIGAGLAGALLLGGSAGAAGPDDPFYSTYRHSVDRMSQPDETIDGVALQAQSFLPVRPLLVSSKTCSQRCSTRCSVSCTTTRGCSSQCKVQTDGCGGGTADAGGTKPKADSELIDLNSASMGELMELPGVGDVTAQKIIDGRPYAAKNDLVTRDIVSKATYDKIKAWIIARRK